MLTAAEQSAVYARAVSLNNSFIKMNTHFKNVFSVLGWASFVPHSTQALSVVFCVSIKAEPPH